MGRALLVATLCLLAAACRQTSDEAPSPTAPQPASPAATSTTAPGGSDATLTPSDDPTPTALEQALVVNVVDGDTIDVLVDGQEYRIRYIGVDTPETVDPRRPVECFGREASERNLHLVEGQTVGLERDVSETDRFGRLLRYVWLNGEMVNAQLVEDGYATASAFPPDVRHAELLASLQAEAMQAGIGLWGPACATPEPPAAGGGPCEYSGTEEPVIKGNISLNTAEKIYHLPAGEFYDQTVIDEAKGERWFCTEADALAAGWRKSQR